MNLEGVYNQQTNLHAAEKERLLRQAADSYELANDLEALIRAPGELGPAWHSEQRVQLLIYYQKQREIYLQRSVEAQEQEAFAAVNRAQATKARMVP